jgi:hypothetical protein
VATSSAPLTRRDGRRGGELSAVATLGTAGVPLTQDHAAAVIIEGIAALSEAAGRLRELDRPDTAHRCDTAAARLQAMALELEMMDVVEEDEGV